MFKNVLACHIRADGAMNVHLVQELRAVEKMLGIGREKAWFFLEHKGYIPFVSCLTLYSYYFVFGCPAFVFLFSLVRYKHFKEHRLVVAVL